LGLGDIDELRELIKNSMGLTDQEKTYTVIISWLLSHIDRLDQRIHERDKLFIRMLEEHLKLGAPVASERGVAEPLVVSKIVNTKRKAMVFDFLLRNGRATREELVDHTGYNPVYLSSLMNSLHRKGLVRIVGRGIYELTPDKTLQSEIRKAVKNLLSE